MSNPLETLKEDVEALKTHNEEMSTSGWNEAKDEHYAGKAVAMGDVLELIDKMLEERNDE